MDKIIKFLRQCFANKPKPECHHESAFHKEWRDKDGVLMSITKCFDCGFFDKGHVHE